MQPAPSSSLPRSNSCLTRRDSFVVARAPSSIPATDVISEFVASNASRLGMTPTQLRARLQSAERLRRRLRRGPEAGQWATSQTVCFKGDPALVAAVLELGYIVLDFQVLEARPFTMPAPHCFHCGRIGHLGRHCRSCCTTCGARHPTRGCPLSSRLRPSSPLVPASSAHQAQDRRPQGTQGSQSQQTSSISAPCGTQPSGE